MNQNAAKEPLSAYGLLGAALGAGLGVAIWYFFLNVPSSDTAQRFAICFVGGIITGALAGNSLGKALRKK